MLLKKKKMGSFHNPEDTVDEELYEAFLNAHADRLRSLRVPECKWKTLCRKLCSSVRNINLKMHVIFFLFL